MNRKFGTKTSRGRKNPFEILAAVFEATLSMKKQNGVCHSFVFIKPAKNAMEMEQAKKNFYITKVFRIIFLTSSSILEVQTCEDSIQEKENLMHG